MNRRRFIGLAGGVLLAALNLRPKRYVPPESWQPRVIEYDLVMVAPGNEPVAWRSRGWPAPGGGCTEWYESGEAPWENFDAASKPDEEPNISFGSISLELS